MDSCYKIRVSLTLFCYMHNGPASPCTPLGTGLGEARRNEHTTDTSFPPTSSTKAFVRLSALTALTLWPSELMEQTGPISLRKGRRLPLFLILSPHVSLPSLGNPYLQFFIITARGGHRPRAEVLPVHGCQLTLAKGSGWGSIPFPRLK